MRLTSRRVLLVAVTLAAVAWPAGGQTIPGLPRSTTPQRTAEQAPPVPTVMRPAEGEAVGGDLLIAVQVPPDVPARRYTIEAAQQVAAQTNLPFADDAAKAAKAAPKFIAQGKEAMQGGGGLGGLQPDPAKSLVQTKTAQADNALKAWRAAYLTGTVTLHAALKLPPFLHKVAYQTSCFAAKQGCLVQ